MNVVVCCVLGMVPGNFVDGNSDNRNGSKDACLVVGTKAFT